MRRALRSFGLATGLAVVVGAAAISSTYAFPPQRAKKADDAKEKKESMDTPALNFTMKDIEGKDKDLHDYYGNVILMVNVASRCGYTPQYKGLETIYDKYKKKGFVVLGFPANNFGGQEPGTDEEIKAFCTSKFDVSFPMFSKVSVKGDDKCELYKYLTHKDDESYKHGGEVQWNFNKFLVNRQGEVVGRFGSKVAPEDDELIGAIRKELAKKPPADSPAAKVKATKKTAHGKKKAKAAKSS